MLSSDTDLDLHISEIIVSYSIDCGSLPHPVFRQFPLDSSAPWSSSLGQLCSLNSSAPWIVLVPGQLFSMDSSSPGQLISLIACTCVETPSAVQLWYHVCTYCTLYLHCRERYEGAIKDLEKKQEAAREKLTRMQQEYRQAAVKAGLVH